MVVVAIPNALMGSCHHDSPGTGRRFVRGIGVNIDEAQHLVFSRQHNFLIQQRDKNASTSIPGAIHLSARLPMRQHNRHGRKRPRFTSLRAERFCRRVWALINWRFLVWVTKFTFRGRVNSAFAQRGGADQKPLRVSNPPTDVLTPHFGP